MLKPLRARSIDFGLVKTKKKKKKSEREREIEGLARTLYFLMAGKRCVTGDVFERAVESLRMPD